MNFFKFTLLLASSTAVLGVHSHAETSLLRGGGVANDSNTKLQRRFLEDLGLAEFPHKFDETKIVEATPDGTPPNWESICDSYGDAKASGICRAYCEAKDCDTADTPSCAKLAENFASITGGQSLPCEVECPCIENFPGWIEDVNSAEAHNDHMCIDESSVPNDWTLVFFFDREHRIEPVAQADYARDRGLCGYFMETIMWISNEEAESCMALLRAKAAAQNLPDCNWN
jgi:hypothetical protein